MIPWLKKSAPSEPLVVSMAGVKLGDRLLIVGGRDVKLVAQLAAKPGLTGHTVLVDEDPAHAANAARTAEREGALLEAITAPWTQMPLERDAFDLAVIRDVLPALRPDRRAGCINEVRRVLRPGGRCLVVDKRSGPLAALAGLRSSSDEYQSSGGAIRALEMESFAAVRMLAERDGLAFVEGVKPNR